MMITTAQRKIKTYIGFAIKSRNIVFGADFVVGNSKKLYLIIYTDSINRTSKSRLTTYSEQNSIPVIIFEDKQMEECVNKINCKCIAIADKNLAEAIRHSVTEGGASNE